MYFVIVLLAALMSAMTCQASCPSRCHCQSSEKMVDCTNRSLTAPPQVYPQGTNIINLKGNHILVIGPRSFNTINSLEVLRINSNKISSLRTDAFRAFTNLRSLDLSDNNIASIARRAFRHNGKLRTLSLNRNRLQSLTDMFVYVPILYQLNLAQNSIRGIGQNDLRPLTQIHNLDLSNNNIITIHPRAFESLQRLRYLYLQYNPLAFVPPLHFGTQVLQLVDFSHCNLTTVPGPFPSSVTELRLMDNNIGLVNYTAFTNMTKLQLLALNSNGLHFLADGTLAHMSDLKEVWLRGNHLVYIPRNLPNKLSKLHIDSNHIQQIETGLFSNESFLEYLTVENNYINRILPNTFSGMRFLTTLNFQGNQIVTLEADTFRDLGSLSSLLLSNNPLRNIENGAFHNLAKLTSLHLSYITTEQFELQGNFLMEMRYLQQLDLMNSAGLADAFMSMINNANTTPVLFENLTHLDLSYNTLEWVSPRVRQVFPRLSSIALDSNPLRCSQNLRWLKDWMVSTNVSFHKHSPITCEAPSRLQGRQVTSLQDHEWAREDEVDIGGSGVLIQNDQQAQGRLHLDTIAVNDATGQDRTLPQPVAVTVGGQGRDPDKNSKDRTGGKKKERKGKKKERKGKKRGQNKKSERGRKKKKDSERNDRRKKGDEAKAAK